MSILLDALKKSEEQRQLGQAPDIHAPSESSPGRGAVAAAPWLPILLVAVAAVVIATFSWRQYQKPEGLAAEVVSEQPAVASRSTGESVSRSAREEAAPAASSPLATYTAPREEPVAETAANAGEDRQKRELAQSFNQFQSPPPAEGAETGETATAPAAQEPEAPVAPSTERRAEPVRPDPAGPRPVSFWELPQNVRDSMPDLRITVLVYADSPEDRFVLVSGRRLVEQDTLEGVLLDEIRRDGAVFQYRNYRFLVRN
jgi:general secretion pathway protein B